jgi:hypothetical protein
MNIPIYETKFNSRPTRTVYAVQADNARLLYLFPNSILSEQRLERGDVGLKLGGVIRAVVSEEPGGCRVLAHRVHMQVDGDAALGRFVG